MTNSLATLAQSLVLAYASGISPYATATLVGLMERAGWIGPLPGALGALANPILLGVCGLLAAIEFSATLIPGVAALWDAAHTAIRPPAAALLAVATVWHADPMIIAVAGLLGGGLAIASHAAKLGVRVAVDASPEPITNGAMNITEITLLATLSYFVWNHPIATLIIALAILATMIILLRLAWRYVKRGFKRPSPKQQAE
jgi:hypothetical protein